MRFGITGLAGGQNGTVTLGSKALNITAAASPDFAGIISGTGDVNITGGKQIVSGDNTYTGPTTINTDATLQIGNGGNSGDLKSDVNISGTLAFNRSDIYNADFNFEGAGSIEQIGSGTSVFTTDHSQFTGQTNVRNGVLEVDNVLGGTAHIFQQGTLSGIGTIGPVNNEGKIMPGTASGFGTLTIAGNYTGTNGEVVIRSTLGGDTSPTNLLYVTGDTVGQSTVTVQNVNGTGGQTVEGIQIIKVDGSSNGNFTLNGSYVTADGQEAVVAGAYSYTLHKNGVSAPSDGAWYLRSTLSSMPDPIPVSPPRFNPGAPIYESYGQTMQVLNKLPTMQERIGNRYWSSAGNPVIEQGADTLGTPLVSATDAGAIVDSRGIWGRIEGAHNRFGANHSTTGMKQDVNTFIIQAGIDGQFTETEAGRLIGGFTVQYGKARGDVSSVHGAGNIDTQGWGLGSTLTWYGDNGFYVDTQAQAMWYDSNLNSYTTGKTLSDGNKGFGYGVSLEGGMRVDLDSYWSLTPQAQLTWSSVDFNTFNDAWGASVAMRNGDSLNARLGISVDYRNAWRNNNGQLVRTNVYSITSLYQEFMGASKINVAGVDFDNANDRTWGGIGAGGTYAWAQDKYALYGEGSINTSLNNFADNYTIKGTVGFKLRW